MQRDGAGDACRAHEFEKVNNTAVLMHDRFFVLYMNDVGTALDDRCCRVASPIRVAPPGPHYARLQFSLDLEMVFRDDFNRYVHGCSLHG